ncbi:hypothetical protein A3C23_02095 [Candidatus Roizmanbacteria bacterium RIFCSPHIGHO2_02_FULL_37_13b]|uniref:Phage holin family protein n=1 Tax=Candidatus Roizmanbacteria bacterium RIFCSPLOWO2_02_FULL_36_11 TaxID=1802071 RepID=A0A1F7JGP6_9BACT|nr:MAG: hypothetical protein A3C23_02095 [Candidatus Roizmanbacteria bacterium RIFCSPHIGHO2_02_FULL_37_13b]OGK54777.1 MAG: hypothetical protein A3H78_05835 [Candidatus Roizmanbacteria bacterium RIFCSPLOWO2_02_FULL_36_11]
MNLIVKLIINALAVFFTAKLLPGIVTVEDLYAALMVAVILGLLNTFVKPILKILTLPITILTLGLFSLIINALIILVVDRFVPGFSVNGLFAAVIFGFVLSVISSLLNLLVR